MSGSSDSAENTAIRDVNCLPCPFSTDKWKRRTVKNLGRLINHQVTPLEQSVALVIGPGGLPYLLGRLQVASLVVADLHSHVIDTTIKRVTMLAEHDTWSTFREDFVNLNPGTSHYFDPEDEFRLAQKSGLMIDYSVTREHASQTNVEGIEGNLLTTAPALAERLRAANQLITFANFTNAADYSGGQIALREHVLDVLPVANDAIIVDSAPTLIPRLYSLETYGN